jgi:molybdopterin converting factor small subunit
MEISIQCFGQVRSITKERYILLDVDESTSVTEALDIFVSKFGPELEKLLYTDGKIREFYFIQVDKDNLNKEDLDTTILKQNQVISIIPFISGG